MCQINKYKSYRLKHILLFDLSQISFSSKTSQACFHLINRNDHCSVFFSIHHFLIVCTALLLITVLI